MGERGGEECAERGGEGVERGGKRALTEGGNSPGALIRDSESPVGNNWAPPAPEVPFTSFFLCAPVRRS